LWLVIVESILAAHRHVFGVLAWYSILAALGLGPAGALFYRLSDMAAHGWPKFLEQHKLPVSEAACEAASHAWQVVDWLPSRITAMGFAVVGSFEEAIDILEARLIPYLLARMERSIAAAQAVVAALDARSLATHRPVTRALAAEVLDTPAPE
jgi:cobalamin biosynthesis protein CobD/CbiB